MKTKFTIVFLILPIFMGGMYCKKDNKKEKFNLFGLLYLLEKSYIEIRLQNNQSITKNVQRQNTNFDRDGDGYPEKFLTPEAVIFCIPPAIVVWEEGEETTIENAKLLYGSIDYDPPNDYGCVTLPSSFLDSKNPSQKLSVLLPYSPKYKKFGFHGPIHFTYKFKDEDFMDKNYKVVDIGYDHIDVNEGWFNNVGVIVPYIKSGYTRLYYPDENLVWHSCRKKSIEEYIDIITGKLVVTLLETDAKRFNFYCNGENDPPLFTGMDILKDGKYSSTSKYRYFTKCDMFDPVGCTDFLRIFQMTYEELVNKGFNWDGPISGAYYDEDTLQYHNQYPHDTRLYEMKYQEYYNENFFKHNMREDIIPLMLRPNLDYYKENFTKGGYQIFVTDVENLEFSGSGSRFVITIDPTDVFMWETEHPEWDYFDRANDAPNPSIGKDLKVYLPRIKVRVE